MPTIETECGKKIKQKILFKNNGEENSGYYAAKKFLKENGFSYGSQQRNDPIGVYYGDSDISKWRNLGKDKKRLDGALCSFSFRERDVYLMLFIESPVLTNEPTEVAKQ